jgi:ATP/maltotriose-dependent transcriptional regulator MalT
MNDVTAAVRSSRTEGDFRQAIDRLYRAREPEVLRPLLERAALDPESRRRADG